MIFYLNSLENENRELKRRLYSVEKIIKRKNLLVYGLPEVNNENTVQIVLEVVKNKLEINLKSTEISDCFRIGKKTDKRDRQILLTLISNLKRSELLTEKRKLKGTSIYINEDLTPEDSERRKVLINKLKEARAQNRNATLRGNRLIVDGEFYTAEDFDISANKGQQAEKQIVSSPAAITKTGTQSNEVEQTVEKQIRADHWVKERISTEQENKIFSESEKKRKLQELSNSPIKTAKRGSPYSTRSNAITTGSTSKK